MHAVSRRCSAASARAPARRSLSLPAGPATSRRRQTRWKVAGPRRSGTPLAIISMIVSVSQIGERKRHSGSPSPRPTVLARYGRNGRFLKGPLARVPKEEPRMDVTPLVQVAGAFAVSHSAGFTSPGCRPSPLISAIVSSPTTSTISSGVALVFFLTAAIAAGCGSAIPSSRHTFQSSAMGSPPLIRSAQNFTTQPIGMITLISREFPAKLYRIADHHVILGGRLPQSN